MPWLLNPAAIQRPSTSAVSPRQKLASGVKDSGAFRNREKFAVFNAGIRSSANPLMAAKCSQSGSNSPNAKSLASVRGSTGMPSGSNAPTTNEPLCPRTYRYPSRSRSTGNGTSAPSIGSVVTCTCAAG